jgi:hypothetical protein
MQGPSDRIVFHYVRWKALLFGALLLALGAAMIWVGTEALDPSWTAQVSRGQYLVDAPFWLRGPVFLVIGALVFVCGAWPLMSTILRMPVVVADGDQIRARTTFGRLRQLPWSRIVAAKRKKNQLILSPAGTNTFAQEIWEHKSVLLDVGMLAAASDELEKLVLTHRPDLMFVDVK